MGEGDAAEGPAAGVIARGGASTGWKAHISSRPRGAFDGGATVGGATACWQHVGSALMTSSVGWSAFAMCWQQGASAGRVEAHKGTLANTSTSARTALVALTMLRPLTITGNLST